MSRAAAIEQRLDLVSAELAAKSGRAAGSEPTKEAPLKALFAGIAAQKDGDVRAKAPRVAC